MNIDEKSLRIDENLMKIDENRVFMPQVLLDTAPREPLLELSSLSRAF